MSDSNYRALGWRFGALTVQRYGAMVGPLTFVLPNGRVVSPLFLAPWVADDLVNIQPGVIAHLRGEWPCAPFGVRPAGTGFTPRWTETIDCVSEPGVLHGHGANVMWQFTEASETMLELRCTYPDDDDVVSLTRRIRVVPDSAAVEFYLRVQVRRPSRIPIGLHFTFGAPNPVIIRPGSFRAGWTYPGPTGAAQAFARDRIFSNLAHVPAAVGTSELNAMQFPLEAPNEDLLQLTGIDGTCEVDFPSEAYRLQMTWRREHFPSLLLWLSNRAYLGPPLNGRTVALGVEPICSAFGMGKAVSTTDNPISHSGVDTAITIHPSCAFETLYRISAIELES